DEDVLEAGHGGAPPRALHHLGRHVEADDAAGGPDGPRGEQRVDAGAATEVEDGLARGEPRMPDGVADAERQLDGLAWQRFDLVPVIERAGHGRPVRSYAAIGLTDDRPRLV